MKYLITHSLLNSWLYWLNCDESYENKAMNDFENTLNKIFFDNAYMKAGREFESLIECIAKNKTYSINVDDYKLSCALEIVDIVKDGTWAVTGNKNVIIDNQEFVLHCRTDILRGREIFDIKFVKYYEYGKYFNNTQHRMYFEILSNTEKFIYLISDGKEVYQEYYYSDDTDSIISVISNFWSWINQFDEYKEIYLEKWKAR